MVPDIVKLDNAILHVGKDPVETAFILAQEMVKYFESVSSNRKHVYLAISGGSTPRTLYQLLASEEQFRDRIPWRKIQLFWVDERWVPQDHPDSNFRMVKETLLSRVPIPDFQIHPMPVASFPPEDAKAKYERVLERMFEIVVGSRDLPTFDLVLLGMGSDGHTASIFPGRVAESLMKVSTWVECPFVPQLNSRRMTLTPVVLNAAREAWFLVCGEKKALTLKKVLKGRKDPLNLPAQMIRPRGRSPKWFVDVHAISELDF